MIGLQYFHCVSECQIIAFRRQSFALSTVRAQELRLSTPSEPDESVTATVANHRDPLTSRRRPSRLHHPTTKKLRNASTQLPFSAARQRDCAASQHDCQWNAAHRVVGASISIALGGTVSMAGSVSVKSGVRIFAARLLRRGTMPVSSSSSLVADTPTTVSAQAGSTVVTLPSDAIKELAQLLQPRVPCMCSDPGSSNQPSWRQDHFD
jgi:hypothetical protein